MVSSAYLKLLIFLPGILIPAYDSSSLPFCVLYSTYKLNKQGDNIQPWCPPFPILYQSVVPCSLLTVASWPAYRFHKRQVRWSSIPISLWVCQFVVIHITNSFSVVNEAEVDFFLEFSCFFYDPTDVGNLISCSSAFSKSSSFHTSLVTIDSVLLISIYHSSFAKNILGFLMSVVSVRC